MLLNKILPIFFFYALVSAQSDCNPFGVRIQYGKQLIDPQSTQKLLISFNTVSPCPQSFLRILGSKGFKDIDCSSNQIVGSQAMNNFTTYVQRCQLTSQVSYGQTFYYNVYGYATGEGDPVQGLTEMPEITAIDPLDKIDPTKILVLADWGVIKTTGFTPIIPSLRNVMQDYTFNLMIVDGDIAYNLETDNGTVYTQFLNMAEDIISRIPVVFVPGNHQNYDNDSILLLNSTFFMYGVMDNLVTGFPFGDLYILPFDPYRFLYSKNSTIDSLVALKSQLSIAQQTGLFVIPFSHYPLVCSGESSNCQSILANMQKYFKAMLDAGVSLYIGAHAHEYERIYPYNPDGTFTRIDPPYYSDGGYLISLVEGVGGSNTDLVVQMTNLYEYTAKYTINETGFGILSANQPDRVSWKHYSTGRQAFVDSMQIIKAQSGNIKPLNNLLTQPNDNHN